MTNIFSISLVTVQYFFPPRTYNFVFSTYCYILYLVLPSLVLLQYCTLFYCQRHTVTSIKPCIRRYLDFLWLTASIQELLWRLGFYNHSDIMTIKVWPQGGHIKRRLLYHLFSYLHFFSLCDRIGRFARR